MQQFVPEIKKNIIILHQGDFFLFPNVRQKMREQRLLSPEEAVEAFANHILKIPTSEWKKCFEK